MIQPDQSVSQESRKLCKALKNERVLFQMKGVDTHEVGGLVEEDSEEKGQRELY